MTNPLFKLLKGYPREGIVVRLYSPAGDYPSTAGSTGDACFAVSSDLAWSATRFTPVPIEYYSPEREWLKPEEIRLLSAVALSYRAGGYLCLYPWGAPVYLVDADLSLSSELAIAALDELAREKASAQSAHPRSHVVEPTSPPLVGGGPYDLRDDGCDQQLFRRVYDGVDPQDHLLVRGLGALLKAPLLHTHDAFHTEACVSLYIALDASLHLILRRLRVSNPAASSLDAAGYLAHSFGEVHPGKSYFEDFYHERVATIHPSSRYGEFPDAPLSADDYYDLREDLTSVYIFLITGIALSDRW